ncbi:hypothetical protein M011DRAFT_487673 [Sporormia fimetaria CBS 119925]|uniref:Matrin-type domain-containing protein n=1 Tax=Sporormia fimetaria CBS 119925 TaxID=1340428 RepID=A0A6A6VA53_9PLEO|nr:hypothetical protein M011DRAFT_487673 [Sporormia fimetaria CBS 119925]
MLVEDQRVLHEDLERLEDAIAELLLDDPKHIRERLVRDHQINEYLSLIEHQSGHLMKLYEDVEGEKERETRDISTGDTMESFQKQLSSIRNHYRRYPNEPVENLEKAYKNRTPEDQARAIARIEAMFTGEEGFGRFFDLTMLHEQYLNLPIHQHARRPNYLQYLDSFDNFFQGVFSRTQKLSEPYYQYLKALQEYLESFMRRTKPLENLDKLFATFDKEFEEAWEKNEVPGWEKEASKIASSEGAESAEGIWCSACKKDFKSEAVYENHLTGKKHKRAVAQQAEDSSKAQTEKTNGIGTTDALRFKERAVAEREYRIARLARAMQTERADTRVNVERKQGMTERERQQELEMLYSETPETNGKEDEGDESDGDDKIYNPLKLPLAWDGKPIPVWLYRLHGLGVEFPCEICGNFVYMGRRAFDKHFNEPRHVYGLKCLGITGNTTLFREITGIEEATKLWKKLQKDKKKEKTDADSVVQMEDSEGNVMPEKIYNDLLAQGIL